MSSGCRSPAWPGGRPYTDIPGTVRYYVKTRGPNFDLDTWYRNFLEGRTFITNGPMVDLTVNGAGLGEEIHVPRGSKLKIEANARLNPDLDKLDKKVLKSQCIPPDSALWRIEQASTFWQARRELLAEAFTEYVREAFPQRRI